MTKNLHTRYVWIVVALLGAGLFFRMLNITKDFSGDETILMEISRQGADNIVPQVMAKDVYPPLTYIFIHYLIALTGSEAWVRFYFVLFGIGVCLLVYSIAKEYLDEKLAVIALSLAVFSPLLIFTSQYVRSYIDSAFWMLLSVLCMLKILKGESGIMNWIGYVISVALSLYTFYFSALLFFAQIIFVTGLVFKEQRFPLKWYVAFLLVGLAFLPWTLTALEQFHNASGVVYGWTDKGFTIGPFRVGLYIRNIFALIGFDPYFLVFRDAVGRQFGKIVLMAAGLAGIGAFIFFSYRYFRCTKTAFPEMKKLAWFLPCLVFLPLVMAWVSASVLNIPPGARYFAAFHALFLILMAVIIRDIFARKKAIGILALSIILLAFAVRIPEAVSSEFDTKGASLFLKSNLSNNDCLICGRICPEDKDSFTVIKAESYFKLNDKGSEYVWVSPGALALLKSKLAPFKKIWFYRVYGNAEIFGLNGLLDKEFKESGYKETKRVRFKNIDVVKYEKMSPL